jgi:hypothetical protein
MATEAGTRRRKRRFQKPRQSRAPVFSCSISSSEVIRKPDSAKNTDGAKNEPLARMLSVPAVSEKW